MEELEQTIEKSPNFLFVLGAALLCLALFWVAGYLLSRKLGPFLQKRIDEDKHPIPVLLLRGFRNPLYIFFILTGLCAALGLLSRWNYSASPAFLSAFFSALPAFLDKTMRVGAIVCVSWGIYASSDIAGLLVRGARKRMDKQMDSSVTRFLSGLFRVLVVAFSVVILLSEFGYNINGLITGLGLGGLTVALVAKDSASNLFGGVVLVVDKPFEIGDWISCSNVEGTVEDINMRNTIIRNDSGSLTTMPNALLSSAPITNFSSAMNQRRADITLTLVLGTDHQQMKEFVAAVRKMLETDPEVVSDSVVVRFSGIGPSSLEVRIIYYTSLPSFREHLRIRERANYAVLDLARQQGIRFATPTQTVLLSGSPPKDEPQAPGGQ